MSVWDFTVDWDERELEGEFIFLTWVECVAEALANEKQTVCFACTLIGFSVDHWFWWCISLLSGGKIRCDEEIRENEAREKPRKFSISNRLICNLRVRRERVYKRVRDEIDICRQRALSHQHHCTFHTESHSKVTKIFLEIVGEWEKVGASFA